MGKENRWGNKKKVRVESAGNDKTRVVVVPAQGHAVGDRPTFSSRQERLAARKRPSQK